ncbi:MAG: hypothetical protein P8L18_13335 [Verrucomicrobiota bacterium]|jgi:hypothetical protein|nr:hypothetical protein [Verrucomicrobiota bacterium]
MDTPENRHAPPLAFIPFEHVAGLASSVSMGALGAFIISVRQINPTLEIVLSVWTWVSFLLASAATWWIYSLIFNKDPLGAETVQKKRLVTWASAAALLSVFCCMGFALRGISETKLKEVLSGVMIAMCFISIVAFFFLKVIAFLQRDDRDNALHQDISAHSKHPIATK